MILTTGGAGFIGSNFVLDWLAGTDEPVLNLDKLTYAGNLEDLASLDGDPRHVFVHGDIGDLALVRRLLDENRPRAVINFAAESHVDRSIDGPGDFIQTNVVGTFSLLESVRAYWDGLAPSAALLADLTAQLIRQYQREGADAFPYGTYHVTAAGDTNWCEYARFVIAQALAAGKALKAGPKAIQALTTEQYPTPAQRPANSRLDTSRFRDTFGLRLPPWQEGVRHVLEQIF